MGRERSRAAPIAKSRFNRRAFSLWVQLESRASIYTMKCQKFAQGLPRKRGKYGAAANMKSEGDLFQQEGYFQPNREGDADGCHRCLPVD
jgi:hypothetical protein